MVDQTNEMSARSARWEFRQIGNATKAHTPPPGLSAERLSSQPPAIELSPVDASLSTGFPQPSQEAENAWFMSFALPPRNTVAVRTSSPLRRRRRSGICRDDDDSLRRLQATPHVPPVCVPASTSPVIEMVSSEAHPFLGVFRPGYPRNFSVFRPESVEGHEDDFAGSDLQEISKDTHSYQGKHASPNESVSEPTLPPMSTFLHDCQTSPLVSSQLSSSQESDQKLRRHELETTSVVKPTQVSVDPKVPIPPEPAIPGVVQPLPKKSLNVLPRQGKVANPKEVTSAVPAVQRSRKKATRNGSNSGSHGPSVPSSAVDLCFPTGPRKVKPGLPETQVSEMAGPSRPTKSVQPRTTEHLRKGIDQIKGITRLVDVRRAKSITRAERSRLRRQKKQGSEMTPADFAPSSPASISARISEELGKEELLRKLSVDSETGMLRRGRKSTGCWTCKLRRKLCDERWPTCFNCEKLGTECDGYSAVRPGFMNDPVEGAKRRQMIRDEYFSKHRRERRDQR